ncbi:MAG TPA: hypothetical protein VGW78_00025 [Candidatus Babeliales bacterium]|jgi:hypothetical protein|nr:hypothetical protein [Candidatus Babeliales bacterium]
MPITSTRSRYEESEKLQNSTEPIITKDHLQKIEAENPFQNDLKQYEFPQRDEAAGRNSPDEQCLSTSGIIAPKLQCYDGRVIAWYPQVIICSGLLSYYGNQSLGIKVGAYSAIKAFTTNYFAFPKFVA